MDDANSDTCRGHGREEFGLREEREHEARGTHEDPCASSSHQNPAALRLRAELERSP